MDETTRRDGDLDLDRALRALAESPTPAGEPGGEPSREELELLGLIPYGLDPVAPSPSLERRVMEAVAAGRVSSAVAAGAAPPPAAAHRRFGSWMLPLAASLALVSLVASGWLAVRVSHQSATIAALEQQLSEAEATAGALAAARGALQVELARITAPGVEVCPLRPMGDEPIQPRARALLFISERDGVWYLRVQDLEAPPPGRVYRLWFYGDEGAMPAGVVTASTAGAASGRLASGALPEQRAMSRGVAVTLEADPAATAPGGPMVLFGDEKMDLL